MTTVRQIVEDAKKIPEMVFAFECICQDDKKEPNDYSDTQIVSEAEYRLYTYFENGHINNDMRLGRDTTEGKKIAQKDVRLLKAFIKKYKTSNSFYSKWLTEVL
jgi:hypothetical protein